MRFLVAAVCALLLVETIGLSSWIHEDEQCCSDAQFDGCEDCACCAGSGPAAVAAAEVIVESPRATAVPLVSMGMPEAPEPREILHVPRRLDA